MDRDDIFSVETWPTGVFDVFESCDVFVLLFCAMYALTMVLICASVDCGIMNSNDLGTIWMNLMAVCLVPFKDLKDRKIKIMQIVENLENP